MTSLNYHSRFQNYLFEAKVGLIVTLIVVTIFYQYKYYGKTYAKTFFSERKSLYKILLDATVTAFLGMLSVFFVIFIRGGIEGVKNHWKAILVVGIILALFNIVQESSGFNRYMDKNNIIEGKSVYNDLEGDTPQDLDEIKVMETGGDPFVVSLSTYCMVVIGIIIIYYVYKMIECSYDGYNSNNYNIENIDYTYKIFSSPVAIFILELAVIGILNGMAPSFSPLIRGEDYVNSSVIIPIAILIIAVCLQVMLQYSGMLEFKTKMKEQ
jgi:hypothetical protein